ncbi:MAG: response regulator transcription factor [Hahellaceae bacterium]|nr:response regulator transcription factor [Hahellaceae bacterium]MCP5170459.1 response regulator transcription factor [Hahellaceae bacterium]
MNRKLLLVEDDRDISEMLSSLLTQNGYDVSCAYDGESGLKMAQRNDSALVILDIMLPGIDGLEVLQALRKTSTVPVLMLTARGDDIDRILGFEMGADDYLPKPFNPRELVARIKAILRRVELDQQASALNTQTITQTPLRLGKLELIPQRRQATLAGEELILTGAEYNVLYELLSHQGEVQSKAVLTQRCLGRALTLYDRALDMHVSNLRKKLGNHLDIKTIRGIGYLLQGN